MTEQKASGGRLVDQLPTDRLKHELGDLTKALAGRAASSAAGKLGQAAGKAPGLMGGLGKRLVGSPGEMVKKLAGAGVEKVKEAVGGGGGGKAGQKGKVTNIVEEINVGVPVTAAYNQWTQFTDFPGFMKKVENVEQESDTELKWRAKIVWSHRDWKSTIVDQVPDDKIVWRSEGAKGYVDGAVTFHKLAPNLTKILMVLEYYPQGFFEKVGNIWRAQGRRARLELKHFRRHVMTEVAPHPEELEGWRGEIHDSEVVKDHQQAKQEQEETREGQKREEREPSRREDRQRRPRGRETEERERRPRREREEAAAGARSSRER